MFKLFITFTKNMSLSRIYNNFPLNNCKKVLYENFNWIIIFTFLTGSIKLKDSFRLIELSNSSSILLILLNSVCFPIIFVSF